MGNGERLFRLRVALIWCRGLNTSLWGSVAVGCSLHQAKPSLTLQRELHQGHHTVYILAKVCCCKIWAKSENGILLSPEMVARDSSFSFTRQEVHVLLQGASKFCLVRCRAFEWWVLTVLYLDPNSPPPPSKLFCSPHF